MHSILIEIYSDEQRSAAP